MNSVIIQELFDNHQSIVNLLNNSCITKTCAVNKRILARKSYNESKFRAGCSSLFSLSLYFSKNQVAISLQEGVSALFFHCR